MSITLGIYDVFSYAIPGILYLYTFNEALRLLRLPNLEMTILTEGAYLLVLGMLAYLVGHLFDFISHKVWYRRFYPGKSEERAYKRFKSLPEVNAEFEPMQWSLLLSVIRHNDMELCNTIDKNKATSIMLRNVSSALFLLTIVFAVSAVIDTFSLIYLLGAIASLVGCIVSLRRSDVFNQWFYMLIFQQSSVYGANLKEILQSQSNGAGKEKASGRARKTG